MREKPLSLSELYAKGKQNLDKAGFKRYWSPESNIGASVPANRRYLDSLFFWTKFLDPAEVDMSCTLFGVKLKVPIFSSPMGSSIRKRIDENILTDIACGVRDAGSLMMVGIGGSYELQRVIDTRVPTVKMVKPYRNTDLIFKKVRDAESRGCVATGMDIDYFYGHRPGGDRIERTNLYGPQSTETLKQLISQTKLPFILKGVLSVQDAERAAQIGASAIIVSNHGNDAIDFSIPSMMALPHIVEKVGNKLTVLVDTGFKTGNDVLKALAFGAKAAGFASSMLLGWGANGTKGVEEVINLISAELKRTMAATGCPNLASVTRSIIYQAHATSH